MKIGDIVYIFGKYTFDSSEKPHLLEVKISHIKHRQFVAYRTDDGPGEWCFSKKHLGRSLFLTREDAEAEQAARNKLTEVHKNGGI